MKAPPSKSNGLLSDISLFFLHKPKIPTLIEFKTEDEREDYSHQIMQRLGIDVRKYSVLNIHKMGIDVPARYAFEEILQWEGDNRKY
jgi:hypothetical protein